MIEKYIKSKKYHFILCFILISNIINAQYPIVRNFTRKAYSSGAQNWNIIQEKNDWMCFANNNGLLEYNGNTWTTYPIANYTNVRSLYYDDKKDRIYAGAFNEFGYFEKNQQGMKVYVSISSKLDKKSKNFSEIWGIVKQNNIIFFHSDNYLFKYENNKITRYIIKEKIAKIAIINNFVFLASEKEGVFVFNDNMLIPLSYSSIIKGKKICAILPYKNKVLFVTELDGIFQYENRVISKFNTDLDNLLKRNQVFCAAIQGDILAIGTVRNGVIIKNLSTSKNTFSNINTGLQNNTVLSISFDRLGNIWLGLDKGIDFICYNSPVYDFFGNNNLYGTGYASALNNNTLYLGTNQGLYFVNYPLIINENGIDIKTVNNIQGQIWNLSNINNTLFCGADHGAYIIKGNNAEKIDKSTGTWAFKILPNNPDYILASSYIGFYLLKKTNGKWLFFKYIKGFDEHGTNFEIDDNLQIWFSHWLKGIYKLSLNQYMDSVQNIKIFDKRHGLNSSQNNRIAKLNHRLIICGENNFYFYNPKNNKVSKYQFLESLFGSSTSYKKVYQSKNNDIWSISNDKIYRGIHNFNNKYSVDSISFSTLKGKLVSGFEHINSIDSNTVLVGTEDGYSIINLQKNKIKNDTTLNVTIRDIRITSKKDSIVNCTYYLTKKEIPKFKSSENSIKFEFIATEYRRDDDILYSYKLEGFDNNWSEFSSKKIKEYTNLKKGKYIFQVRAKNLYNNLTSETSYSFIISPAWYESFIARIFYIVLIFFVFYFIIKFLNTKSHQKIIGITEQKEQEMKIQEEHFLKETEKKEDEIINLKNQKLQYELRHKSQDLASSTMNLIRKNEVLLEINKDLDKVEKEIASKKDMEKTVDNLHKMQLYIKKNIQYDNSWKKFQENFDLVYENYLKRLGDRYPTLTVSDKKLCAYLKMNLNSKEIAPLLNMSYRSVEMSRYRLRKKLDLHRNINLTDFLQKF